MGREADAVELLDRADREDLFDASCLGKFVFVDEVVAHISGGGYHIFRSELSIGRCSGRHFEIISAPNDGVAGRHADPVTHHLLYLPEPAEPVAPASKKEPPAAPLNLEDFKNDPLIQKALELFKGQIVDVRT